MATEDNTNYESVHKQGKSAHVLKVLGAWLPTFYNSWNIGCQSTVTLEEKPVEHSFFESYQCLYLFIYTSFINFTLVRQLPQPGDYRPGKPRAIANAEPYFVNDSAFTNRPQQSVYFSNEEALLWILKLPRMITSFLSTSHPGRAPTWRALAAKVLLSRTHTLVQLVDARWSVAPAELGWVSCPNGLSG